MTRILRIAASAALVCTVFSGAAQDAPSKLTPEARADALKVLRIIETIQAESAKAPSVTTRSAVVTERELNAYIAHRIETEKEDVLTDLRLKIFPDNRIEGLAVIDLRGRKLPAFIKPMAVWASATAVTMMTAVSGCLALISCNTSVPDLPGIIMSSKTRSTRSAFSCFRALLPLGAVRQW